MATPLDPVQAAFEAVMNSFKADLKDKQVYNDLLQITTIDQVYDATDEIQKKQAKEGHLRHLSKISPYLQRLNEYATTIEVFTQVKPEVLSLIWGPIKLLLQWTSVLKASFDAIVNTMAEIGELLPEFKRIIALFDQNSTIKDVMVLFFRDILDFYLVTLKFFRLSRWKYLFESLWPSHKEKIKVVMTHIQNHVRLVRNEVRLEHIQQEHEARRRALENFEREEQERRSQEFYRLKTSMAPRSYDDRLDLLRHLVYQGTGVWLLQDATFKKWLDFSSAEPRILWLQGIPGAGKTCLASEVIEKTQSKGRTSFAFISYKDKRIAAAISIVHSLIFRLVSGNGDLETVVCESCNEECKQSLKGAGDLLVAVLRCAGPTYLIVDGVDEMEETERGRLLAELLRILKLSPETRLFISSRAEADLLSILRNDATVITIEQKNFQCIRRYIRQWAQDWVVEREFWPAEQTEIKLGLEQLALKSQGMFLYARVVLESIRFLESFEDIRKELTALPESLDDAYGRILRRINSLDNPLLREKARLVLGWVGCSPTPLTVQEIQQIWIIDLGNSDSNDRVRGNLDLVRLCGPIVELVDDYVQFVHFTVKEYIFSPSIDKYIDLHTANLDLALRCITYLWGRHHNPDVSSEEMKQNVLSGIYTIDWFATNTWPQLVKTHLTGPEGETSYRELGSRLDILYIIRLQDHLLIEEGYYDGDDDDALTGLAYFKDVYPEPYALIGKALRFRQLCTASEHRMDSEAPWTAFDPLTTSESSIRIRRAVEDLLSDNEDGEVQANVWRFYGSRPYKCEYLSCPFNRTGFQGVDERRKHTRDHDRPWKCSIPGCEYVDGGFFSRKMRDQHLNKAHSGEKKRDVGLPQLADVEEIDVEEIRSHLVDLAKAGLVESVCGLLSRAPDYIWDGHRVDGWTSKVHDWASKMWVAATQSGSLRMVELWHSQYKTGRHLGYPALPLEYTVREKNMEMLNCLLGLFSAMDIKHWPSLRNGTAAAIEVNDEAINECFINFSKSLLDPGGKMGDIDSVFTSRQVIRATAGNGTREELLIAFWNHFGWKQREWRWQRKLYGVALINIARTTCSISLAGYLVDAGVEIDHRHSVKYPTPLHYAATQDKKEAADLMRFLIHHGANPNPQQEPLDIQTSRGLIRKTRLKIQEEKGPLGISKWLGITWEELLKEAPERKPEESCQNGKRSRRKRTSWGASASRS